MIKTKTWGIRKCLLLALAGCAVATPVRAQWFQVRNTAGGASPNQPGTVYLGDTGLTFGCDSWGNLGGAWGGITIYIHTGTDIHNGTAGGAISYSPSDGRSNTSGKFTSTGTWYWGARMQYNTSGTVVGWYCRNRSFWSDAWGTPTSDLSITVSALNNPSGQSANRNTTNPSTDIDLAWTRGTSGTAKDTLILRGTSTISTDPTGGTSYSVGNSIGSATVIYKSSGTTFTDSSLSGDTLYYFKFYSINNDYYSSGVTANHITLATEPTISASNLTFTSVGTSSMTVNWQGVATQVLAVARSGSDLSHDPGDTTNYTANAAFGSGSSLGSGSVVYRGNASNVTVTSLSPDTLYYYRIYNFRGSGGTSENYRTSDELNGSQYTLATEPTAHVTGFSAATISQSQINLSWTAAAGPPTGYIILQRSGAAPTGSPADGTGYSVGNTIGDGTVAAIVTPGSSTSANITGLSASTAYYFAIFPYNGSAAQAYNYRTAATVPTANATTLPNAPGTVTGVTASDGTNTTYVYVSWDDAIGETGYVIWRNTLSAPASATAIYTNDAFTLDLSDTTASPGQLYYYWVTATNTGGSSSMSASNTGYRKLATVTGLAATDSTFGDKVQLTWDNMTGETGYGIWRHTSDASGSATYLASTAADTVSYDDTTATPGVTYYYWVRSTNNTSESQSDFQGTGEQGTRANTTTVPSLDAPSVTAITYQGATLGANISTNGGDTITSRGTVWNTTGAPVTENGSAEGGTSTGVFSHARSGMAAGTLIYFRGYAVNGQGTGYSSMSSFWTVPHAPTPSAASSIGGKSFAANWSSATGSTNYLIDVSTASDFSSYVSGFQSKLLGTVTTIGVTGLTENTTYYWRLRAQTSGGTSTNSVSATTLTAPLAPVATAATNWTTSTFFANWNSSAGATSYRLDVSIVSDFSSYVTGWQDANVGNVVTYLVNSGLSAGTNYYYRLRAINTDGTASTNSNVITLYTLSSEPTAHATAFSATPVSDTQINLGWTAAAGPPSGYIVLQKTSSDPTGTPTDGTGYSVGNTIGDGTVAAIVTPGSATSVNITGLSAGTDYHFSIIPFNWDNSHAAAYNYYTAATIPTANATTYSSEPTTQASSITFSLIGKDSNTVSWTSGNGATRIVVAKEASAVNANPVDATAYTASATFGSGTQIGTGNYVVYSGAGSSVVVVGLKTNTTYHYRVYEFNGSGVTANYNTNSASGNPASQATRDNEAGMKATPASFNITTMVGSSPSAASFGVTNVGGSSLSYSVTTNVNWLSVSPVTGSGLAAAAGQQHTITYSVGGLYAGVSNATITITDTGTGNNVATNGPLSVTVALTLTNIPDPTAVSATASGAQFVRLVWTKAPDHNVMIVHKAGSASTAPANGTAYSVGNSVGGGTVIYSGAGNVLEHVVTAGTTHYYTFYSINNNHYSTGMPTSVSTTTYATPIVETFSYTNGSPVSGLSGGTGWTNNWSYSLNASMGVSSQQFAAITGYQMAGNIITGNNTGIYREFPAVTTGKIYAVFMFRTANGDGSSYGGMSFFNNSGSEQMFFGEGFAAVNQLSITGTNGSHQLANNTDYTIVALYDFEKDFGRALLYTNATQSIPSVEPVTWHLNQTNNAIARINGLRLQSSVNVSWDEVRIGYSWADLFGAFPTYDWDAGGGSGNRDWSTAANWTADTEPIAVSNAFINGGYTGVVSSAGEVAANLYVGNSGTGRLEQTGGTLSLTNFYLGFNSTDRGDYIMTGGSLTVAVDMAVGYSGVATAQIHGAASKISLGGNLEIGFSNANNRASFLQGGGTVTVFRIYLGKSSATEGSYVITNGVLSVLDDIYLADGNGNSTGRFVAAGNAVVNIGDEFYVGRNGQGFLAVRDSAAVTLTSGTGLLIAGDLSGNNKTNIVQLGGGTLTVGSDIQVGDAPNAYGMLIVSNGTVNSTGSIYLGNIASSRALMSVEGGFVDPVSFYVGYLGTGTLNVTGGSITANVFHVGSQAGSEGIMTMSGGNLMVEGTDIIIGNSGLGTLILSGGTITAGDGSGNTDFTLGGAAGGKGTVIHTGGTLIFDDPASSDDTDLVIGGTSSTGQYVLAGSGVLNVGGGDDILINDHGELKLVGNGWTATVDDDFTMSSGAALGVVYSNGIGNVVVDTDITIAGSLNFTNVGAIPDGTYTIVTSITRSVTGTFLTTNWLGGITGTVSYTDGKVAITFVTPPEIAVLGTNYAEITSGDPTPSTADGTDFGSLAVAAGTVSRTFFITNSGGGLALNITGVTTSGTEAADFTVLSWPSRVDALTASNLTVQFDPSAVGLRTAVVVIANDDSNENPYTFTIQGTGTAPGISNNPTVLNVSSTLGSTPASVSFGVTNIGTGTLAYDISTNASWLTVSPVAGSLGSLAGQQHTVTFATLAGFAAGTSNATITVSGATATNSPKTVTVSWTISAIADPSAQVANADGKELVRLDWTKNASYDVMIIHDSAAISTEPTQGTSYSVGNTIGSGRVIYKGNGASLEHVVTAGSANHYKFYSINNNYYSPGVSANVTMGSYGAGEIVEVFAYTNNASLGSAHAGGQGWSGGWSTNTGTWVVRTNGSPINFTHKPNYPSNAANRIRLNSFGVGTSAGRATRTLATPFTNGTIYVAAHMSYEFQGPNKWMGINFMSNGNVKAFFGEIAHDDKKLGLSSFGGTNVTASYNMNDFNTDTNNTYLVVGAYEFATRTLKVVAYYRTTTVPSTEPGTWDAYGTVPAGEINMIDSIRLYAGCSDSGWLGDAYYDEIRVADTWENLLNIASVVATNYNIGNTTNYVFDQEVKAGTFPVVMTLRSEAGVETTNTTGGFYQPNFDLLTPGGLVIVTDKIFSAFSYSDSGRTVVASNSTHSTVDAAAVTLGVYTGRFSAIGSNAISTVNRATLKNGSAISFTVIDEDSSVPSIMTTHSPDITTLRNMHVSTNNAGRDPDGGSTTNIRYSLTDGQLAGISGGSPLVFWFGARDAESGLQRGTGSATTNSSLTIGSAIVSNTLQWDASRSSAFTNTYDARATNAWTWTSPFSATEINNLVTNTAFGYGTNRVSLTWRDADNDRNSDQSSLVDQQHGFLIVFDDDTAAPVHSGFTGQGRTLSGATFTNDNLLSGLIITGLVNDAGSGVYAGTSNTYALSRDGTPVDSGSLNANFSNGGNGGLSNTISAGFVTTAGAYTLTVYSVDYDIDRPGDSLSVTSFFSFAVVDAPPAPGLGVTPLVLTYDVILGGTASNNTFTAQNVGTGTLLYTNYQAYGAGASGWFVANPTNFNLAAAVTRVHTGIVNIASVTAAGTYLATNRVAGNQTNAALDVVVTLNVTNIPNPTAQSATTDGREMVRLAWTKRTDHDVMIVHDTSPIATEPTQGSSYAVGASVGTGKVIYKGSGSALEHIVDVGAANYYKFYSILNNFYSTGVTASATTGSYGQGEIVDQFAYTNAVSLGGKGTGQGWTNSWAVSAPNTAADTIVDNVDFATFQQYWPTERANRFVLKTTNSSTYTATRNFAGYTSGKFYVAFLYRREFNEGATDGKFSGARILQGTTEVAFVGERGGSQDDTFGVSSGSGNNVSGGADSFPAATDYLVIGRYDFSDGTIAGIYYTSAQSVPATEPTFFTVATNAVTRIDGIQLVSGATAGWNGQVYFDEVRVASSWANLLRLTQPNASAYVINGGNNVSDGQVATGTFSVQYDFYDPNGITNSASLPSFDIWNSTGTRIVSSNTFSSLTYSDAGRALRGSNTTHTSVSAASVTLGTYTSKWTAANSNGVFVNASAALSNGTVTVFTVYDDDTLVPEVNFIQSTNNAASRNLHISLAANAPFGGSGSSTNITYTMTDGDLAAVATTGPLIFWFGARDADSGLARSTANASTNTSFSIGSAIVSNVANYDAARSTPDGSTTAVRPTNVWTWTSAFSGAEINNLVTNTALGYGTNAVKATIRDGDLDRGATDQLSLNDQQVGILVVNDDDTTPPVHSGFTGRGRTLAGATFTNINLSAGLVITGLVNDAGSGVYDGTSNTYVLTRNGTQVDSGSMTCGFVSGGNGSLSNTISAGIIQTVGTYTMSVFSVDYDIDRPGDSLSVTSFFTFVVVDPPQAPGLAVSPATLTYHVMLGGPASNNTFSVTNIGTGNLIYTNYQSYGTNGSGWFTSVPLEFTNGTFASRIHTGVVSLASITTSRTYVATNTVAGNQTNAAQTVVVTLVVTNIPEAQALAATSDGPQLIRLSATEANGRSVLIVHSTSALNTSPTNGTAFNVGDALGNGTVIFKFVGSATPTNVEHIVPAGSANFYKFFAINNNHYSTGTTISVSTTSYDSGELVDQFAYTNGVALNGKGTGQGWTNTWAVTAPYVAGDVQVTSNNFIGSFQPDYPTERANYVILKTTNSSTYAARRNFTAYSSGKIYIAAAYRRAFNEGATDGKFSGIRLVSGATEVAFFGERGGSGNDDIFGVSSGGAVNNYGAVDSFASATEYLIIGKYDFTTHVLEGIYYTTAQAVPSVEPTFFVSATNTLTNIDGIELASGAISGWNGDVHFDEIRVAASWQELLRLGGGPYTTNYIIGGNATNYVTDGAVRGGTFPVVMNIRSGLGVETTNTLSPFFKPNFDLWNASGIQILTNQIFGTFTYEDSGRTAIASNTSHFAAAADQVVLGTYTSRFSAIASNSAVTIDRASLSNGTAMTFTVFDDDSVAPTPGNMTSPESGSSRSMHVTSNATAVTGSSSSTNIAYTLRDGDLASFSGANPLIFYFGAVDSGSGLARGNDTALTNSSLTIGQGVVSNVFNWDATRSSGNAETDDAAATNVWSWVGAFLSAEIDNLVTNNIDGYGTNKVTVTWRDADSDRTSDQTTLYDYQHGYLVVVDDDTTVPTIQNFRLYGGSGSFTATVAELQSGSGWAITGKVSDASGINVNGSSTTQPNISPYFQLLDPSGTIKLTQVFDTIPFADGGATTLSSLGSFVNGSIAVVPTGTWTARVVVADNDEDRTSDRSITTNEFAFEVITGPSQASMTVAPNTLNVTSRYGSVAGGVNWPNIFVTNNGIGTLTYSASFSYSGGSGWLGLSPSNNVSVGTGNSTTHVASISTAGLNPGTYQATVSLVGNQTNGTKTVTVNLVVIGYYANEIVDPFTNSVASGMGNASGGSGWTNNWSSSATNYTVDAGNLSVPGNYPTAQGNKICADSTKEPLAVRSFSAFTTGKVYAAVAIRKTDGANGGYAGLSFMDGATEKAFVGKLFNIEWFGIDIGGSSASSTFGIYGSSTYMLIIKHDFDAGTTYGLVYNAGDTLSLTEPGSWRVSLPNAITRIDGIRLAGKDVGTLCFDEIRVNTSWQGLLNQFAGEPTLQASGMTFTNVTTNSMTVGWNNGNGGARVVIARQGSPVTFSPTDTSNYTANSDFSLGTDLGSGNKVVYNGSANSLNLSGLTSETNYFFAVYEYNGSGLTTDYLTNGLVLTGSRWTLKTEPAAAVTDLVAYTVSDTVISNRWTAPVTAPTPDGYLIFRRIGAAPTNTPADGVGYTNNQLVGSSRVLYVTNGTDTAFLHENLLSCSDYYFSIFPFRYNPASSQTYNYYTTTPGTTNASTDCTSPTMQASNLVFTSVGTNQVTVSWADGDGEGRIVVVRGTNTVNQSPVDGTTYTANASYGSGSHLGSGNYVAYIGTGSAFVANGLIGGQTYSFHVYEYNGAGSGIAYNTNNANLNPDSITAASFGLVEEKFGYSNFQNLSGLSGGTGWTNNWATGGALVESSDYNLPRFGAYPTDSSTVCGAMYMANAATANRTATRNFPGVTSGRIYISLKVNDSHSMALTDYLGVNIRNGGVTTGFFGKAYNVADRRIALEYNSQYRTNRLDGSNSGYQINAGVDYLLVAMYDFDTKDFKLTAFTTNNLAYADPDREQGWRVEMTNVTIDRIDGIQIVASDNDQIVGFDHIRIGPSWEGVVWNLEENHHENEGPTPTLIYIGTNYSSQFYSQVVTNLSDAELRSAQNIDFAVRWESPYGVFTTNNVTSMAVTNIGSPNGRVNPNWDPLAVGVTSNQFNLDKFFTNYFGVSGDNVITSYNRAAFNITNIDFEVLYFVTVSAETQPGGTTVPAPNGAEAVPVQRAITINEPLRFYVYDDDTNVPIRGASGLMVMTNGAAASFQVVGADRRYFVTDGSLASVGLDVSLNAYDGYSGIQRSTSADATTNMSLTVDGLVTDDSTRYNASRSTANTLLTTATNVWTFPSTNFTYAAISALWGGDGSGAFGDDLNVSATIPDSDEDRLSDQSILSNQFFGLIRLSDDDSSPPVVTNITYGTGTVNNRPFYVATNGYSAGSSELIRGTYDRRSGVGSDTIFSVTDEELANPATRGIEFVFGVQDNDTGISRATSGTTNDVMSFSIGSNIVIGVVTGYNATLSSSSAGPGVLQTNIWTFNNGFFTESQITSLMARTDASTSSTVRVTVPDADNDRVADRSVLFSQVVGQLKVYDDDVAGPTMSGIEVPESQGGDTILSTSFETAQGWPVSSLSSTTIWTNNDVYGPWVGEGVTHTSLDPKNSGTRRLGFLTNSFPNPWLQLPPMTNPGTLFLYGARVSSGSGAPKLRVERYDGDTLTWVSYGDKDIDTTTYMQYAWDIDEPGSNIMLRIRRVDGVGIQRTQVYVDDVSLTARSAWISTNQIHINWVTAVDDYSGIDEYRYVPPAEGSVAPMATNSGSQVSSAVTTTVQSILGSQGVITGYIFAIDNDNDRSNDRAMGNVAPIIVRVDTNPPPILPSIRASDAALGYLFDDGIDESTEIKVEWAPAAASEAQASGWRQSDAAPLSPWYSYQVTYYEVQDENNVPIAGAITTTLTRATAGWGNVLNSHTFTNLVLSNLTFDAYYSIWVRGIDEAGNIGPVTNVIGNTDRFVVTQGVNRIGLDLQVFWKGVEGRDYDVLYSDSSSGFNTGMSNQWAFMQYTNSPVMFDTGGVARVRPGELTNTSYRFYRVAKTGRWSTNMNPRLASVEVYVTKALDLYPGENWHSLFFIPDTATVSYVFNTNLLPAADNFAEASKISWFGPSYGGTTNQSGVATAVVWLADSGNWIWYTGGVGVADEKLVPQNEGFLLELPDTASRQSLVLIGLLPTQEVVQAISGGSTLSNNIHLLSYTLPVRTPITNMGFKEAGLYGNNNGSLADEVKVLTTRGSGSLESPKARLRLRSDQTTWQYYSYNTNDFPSGAPAANQFVIEPDDAVVIVRRAATPMSWTNKVLFIPPTKNITP